MVLNLRRSESLTSKLSILPFPRCKFLSLLNTVGLTKKNWFRCNARIYTQFPLGTAIMTVELMLTLRVLALCELMTKSHSSHELVLIIHCCFRWEFNRKEEYLFMIYETCLVVYLLASGIGPFSHHSAFR